MEELLFQYVEVFDENFPIFLLSGMDEKEIKEIVQKCLDEGIPYEVKSKDDMKY